WQNTDEVNDLSCCLPLESPCADELGNMGDPRPIDIKIGAQILTHFDEMTLKTSPLPIKGLGLLKLSRCSPSVRGERTRPDAIGILVVPTYPFWMPLS